MSKIKYIILFAILALSAVQLLAWGPTGHRVVTQIAYDNLNCRARHRVDRILGKHGTPSIPTATTGTFKTLTQAFRTLQFCPL